jgi:hypothetical protein
MTEFANMSPSVNFLPPPEGGYDNATCICRHFDLYRQTQLCPKSMSRFVVGWLLGNWKPQPILKMRIALNFRCCPSASQGHVHC